MATASAYQDEDGGAGVIADINVTPLVDITLVLLIIFMVTAKLIVARGIPTETPRTVSGMEVTSTLEVTLKPGRQVFLNGDPIADLAVLAEFTRAALAQNPELRPILTADRNVPHGEVMEVIDVLKVAGVDRFALTSRAKTEAAPAPAEVVPP
jgi:biopolymer transport protein ExbD